MGRKTKDTSVPLLGAPLPLEVPPPPADEDAQFKWRGDPLETFSDWKVEIATQPEDGGSRNTEVYHVHKCILARGTRKSEYFARMFRSDFNESASCTSRIELKALEAMAFPALLDYIYAPDLPLHITTETATALHSLGEYFEMPHLRWDALQFCLKDISLDNADTYCEHVSYFQDETVRKLVAKFLGDNIEKISLDSKIVMKADPILWTTMDGAPSDAPSRDGTLHWSKLVSEIGKVHAETIAKATFDDLTAPNRMPVVHQDAALVLCDLDDKFSSRDERKAGFLSSIQQRSATTLALKWTDLALDFDEIEHQLQVRRRHFLVDLLKKSLKQAKADLDASKKEVMVSQEKFVKSEEEIKSLTVKYARCESAFRANQAELSACQEKLKRANHGVSERFNKQSQPHTTSLEEVMDAAKRFGFKMT